MYRFFYQGEDLESIVHFFYFSTSSYFLSLRKGPMIIGETVEEVLEEVNKLPKNRFGHVAKILKDAIESQQDNFDAFLKDIEKTHLDYLRWRQLHSPLPTPVGEGYIKNPSDPVKGKKAKTPT